jgi:hypothetical protein
MTPQYFVLFADILGFQKMIDSHFNNDAPDIFNKLEKAFEGAKKQYAYSLDRSDNLSEVSYKQFSDCVSISSKIVDNKSFTIQFLNFVTLIHSYHRYLLASGVYIRGGISVGKHLESDNIIFSEALVKAYKIESTISIYPRIVVDNSLSQRILSEMPEQKMGTNLYLQQLLVVDWDNTTFTTPFSIGLSELLKETGHADKVSKPHLAMQKEVFESTFNRTQKKIEEHQNDSKVCQKYQWFLEFLHWYGGTGLGKIEFKQFSK